jgi:hypothetical protein
VNSDSGTDPDSERAFDREGATPLAVGWTEESEGVENGGTGAGSGSRITAQEEAAIAIEFDGTADVQRAAEIAQPPVQGLAADGSFADDQLEVAERLGPVARRMQGAYVHGPCRSDRPLADEPDLAKVELERA